MPRANFDGVSSLPSGDKVPDGTYLARIDGIEPGTTKGGGIKWDVFSIITDGPEKAKVIRDQWLWYGGGMGRTKACISGCGVEVLKGDADYFSEDFIGRPVYLTVRNEKREYDGKTYEDCKPIFNGYSFDQERPYTPMPRRPVQQKLAEDSAEVPF